MDSCSLKQFAKKLLINSGIEFKSVGQQEIAEICKEYNDLSPHNKEIIIEALREIYSELNNNKNV